RSFSFCLLSLRVPWRRRPGVEALPAQRTPPRPTSTSCPWCSDGRSDSSRHGTTPPQLWPPPLSFGSHFCALGCRTRGVGFVVVVTVISFALTPLRFSNQEPHHDPQGPVLLSAPAVPHTRPCASPGRERLSNQRRGFFGVSRPRQGGFSSIERLISRGFAS